MRIVLRGRRSCLLWLLTFLCLIGISVPALTVAARSPLSSALRARWLATPAAEVAHLVRSYRDAESAALRTLDEDVLTQLPIFAEGEALDELTQRVRTLRADGHYQQMEIESFEVVHVVAKDPYFYVMTNEVLTTATYAQAPGDAVALERKSASWEVVYQLAHDKGRWKVAKVVVAEKVRRAW